MLQLTMSIFAGFRMRTSYFETERVMIGTLTREQSEHVLRSGLIGRIGCSDRNGVYVIPITYVYDGRYIYAHSREGI